MIDGKSVLITGGTGSFGKNLVKELLDNYDTKEIVIFSRDEKKQFDMRNNIDSAKMKYIIGDVRDRNKVFRSMENVDLVFHAAALKHVPACEFFPMEAIKTNIIGTNNVLDAAESIGVEKIVVLSTDKAVYPINTMGISKALLEKLMLAKARTTNSNTKFCGVRYGNVMYSRGSVIPLFINQLKNNKPLTITNPKMTRYLLTLPIAIQLVLFALNNADNGDILVRKAPASTIENIANSILNIFNSNVGLEVVGIREGEKMHETLVTREELIRAEDLNEFFKIKYLMDVDYDEYFQHGNENKIPKEGYNSKNAQNLSLDETKDIILSLDEINQELS